MIEMTNSDQETDSTADATQSRPFGRHRTVTTTAATSSHTAARTRPSTAGVGSAEPQSSRRIQAIVAPTAQMVTAAVPINPRRPMCAFCVADDTLGRGQTLNLAAHDEGWPRCARLQSERTLVSCEHIPSSPR